MYWRESQVHLQILRGRVACLLLTCVLSVVSNTHLYFLDFHRSSHSPEDSSYLSDQNETRKLKELIQQRDNEISILYHHIEER